jgi:uncharacterized phiE125 gp8 family phage protein
MSTLRQLAAPSGEPVQLAEARAHLRVDNTAEDALIAGFITAARMAVEADTGRCLLPQDWELRMPCFGTWHSEAHGVTPGEVRLPHAPIIAVQAVATAGANGVETVLATTAWQASIPSGPAASRAILRPAAGQCWPTPEPGVLDAVRIRYRAGYASVSAVPAPLRAAILLMVGDLFANREAASAANVTDNPACMRLLNPYRLSW